jgi:hypothetical protein
MTSQPATGQPDDAGALRAGLRRDLTTALKARDTEAVAALRIAIAAIDNAQAVSPDGGPGQPEASAHVAGARSGAGSTEAARRQLSRGELHDVLRDLIAEQDREADRYDALGQAAAAGRLRRQSRTLTAYLR